MIKWRVLLAAALSTGALAAGAGAEPGTHSQLAAISGQGAGIVEVAPTADDVVGPGTFDVQGTVNVHNAAPGTTFTVLRRVDLNPDGVCKGATWLTLPPPNEQTFTTSDGGGGDCTSRFHVAPHFWMVSASTCSGVSSAATAPSSRATASPSR